MGLGCAAAQAADDCPTVQSAGKGFIVERGERSKTEILHAGPTDVRTIYRVEGRTLLEVTLFQGLFELERIDRGRRATYRPVSDLAKSFPPAPGKKITAVFEAAEGESKGLRTFVLEVRKSPIRSPSAHANMTFCGLTEVGWMTKASRFLCTPTITRRLSSSSSPRNIVKATVARA